MPFLTQPLPNPKSVLITGCSFGSIGSALAIEFQKRGYLVFATGRSHSKIAHLAPFGIETLILDVTSPNSISSAVRTVSEKTGGTLDILFNNAGQVHVAPLLDTDINDMKAIYDVNVFAVVNMTQAFFPLLSAAATPSWQAIVVNHGSISSLLSPIHSSVYASSKAALSSISDVMRIELAPFHIRVVHLISGLAKSNLMSNHPPPKLPAHSVYDPVRQRVEDAMSASALDGVWMETDAFANKLVGSLLSKGWFGGWLWGLPKWIYQGSGATTVWFLSLLLWRGALDRLMAKFGGLGGLEGLNESYGQRLMLKGGR